MASVLVEKHALGERRKQRSRRCAVKRAGIILTTSDQPSSSAALNRQRGKNTVKSSRLLLFFARVETPCVQRLRRSSYASEVRVTSQVEAQKKPNDQHNQTKQNHQTTPTQKRPKQKTATWYVAQAAVSAK